MFRKSGSPLIRRSLALVIALLLSGGFELLTIPAFAQTSTKKSGEVRVYKIDTLPQTEKQTQPIYGDKGPLMRVALITDATTISLSSESEMSVRRSPQEKPVVIAGDLHAEIRQSTAASTNLSSLAASPTPHRVEVTTSKDAQAVKKIMQDIKSQYDQTATTVFDSKTGEYRVVTGKYSSKNQALDMAAMLREAGYSKARAVPIQTTSTTLQTATRTSPGKTGPTAYKTQPSAKESLDLSRQSPRPQMVALDAENLISASDKLLIIAPVEKTLAKAEETSKPAASAKSTKPKPRTVARTTRAKTRTASKPASAHARPPARPDYYKRRSVSAISETPLLVRVGNQTYRGEIHLTLNERGRINVVNVLPLEEYLRGVVPLELSPSLARLEALKAQAVAARSYAIANLGRFRDEGFDLRDDQRSQVYGGFSSEHALTNRAVEETRGVVAMTFSDTGKAVPIEALYSANCGGRTENNENIFLSKAIPYLRSVACPLDAELSAGREITSGATLEPLPEPFGQALVRDIALLSVLGFALPNRITNDYINGVVDKGELQSWAERAARLIREKGSLSVPVKNEEARPQSAGGEADGFDIHHEIALLKSQKRDITRLPGFATLVALATYGEHRESLFMSPSEIQYLLTGLGAEEVPQDARADVALLIKDGLLKLSGDGRINVRTAIKRGQAMETMARALAFHAQAGGLNLVTATTLGAASGALLVPASTSVRTTEPVPLAIEANARLFRVFGKERYGVARLAIRGGERVTYHLNAAGRIDFLEVETAARDGANPPGADQSKWSESLSLEEAHRRLARARVEVGEIQDIAATGFGASRRVVELAITGSEKTVHLRGQQIRTIFGLKDNPLVIERQRDGRGQATGFTFAGSGFGHGVGLCQVGAAQMASQGHSYIGILQTYYTGISVQKIY